MDKHDLDIIQSGDIAKCEPVLQQFVAKVRLPPRPQSIKSYFD